MENPVLNDPSIYPTEDVIFSHLGRSKASFTAVFDYNHNHFPDFVERWKYYRDGKSWLMNVSQKKKTLFWLSIKEGCFRTSFYFSTKFEQDIADSDLPKEYKNQFASSAGKKFRAITLVIKTKKDVAVYKELLSLKLSCL